ncbi:type II toxin-antitoxin system death-on-curing family toxin [Vibrio parahaemolyticus]|uniref:type II toxin-antitoxin system death-on-curing family toxin n=1 Tax=Vibrio parahaemolyticus TaxID=670 RepID=UPI00226B5A09|nr:type II toxin-antitoxin system death-on-curing family toxin [Vibrio parahaemolyticus]MCX8941266.1 type II toxin-antitoxin system death-on-curing family toxin [Vibrio parahaemolyticus]
MITLTTDDVINIHDTILDTERGLHGYHGDNALGGALGRIENQVNYGGIDDVFEIAAWYVESIARGHCFADANKRTALVSALTYLELNDITIPDDERLADMVEDLVKREITREDVALIFEAMALTN